jgi:hypothetical protein
MMPSSRGSVVIEWRWVKTGQTAGFQSFRMRMFKVRGYCRYHKEVNSFNGIEVPESHGSKLSHPSVCPVF